MQNSTNMVYTIENPNLGKFHVARYDDVPWLVMKDLSTALGYVDTEYPTRYVSDKDKNVVTLNIDGSIGNETIINEYGLCSLAFLMRECTKEKELYHWIMREVFYPTYEANEDLAAENKRLKLENERLIGEIAKFKHVDSYIDTILSSDETMSTAQISADYGLLVAAVNEILCEKGLQYRKNGRWVLYNKYMNRGYIKPFDSECGTKLYMQWTKKGRLLIHSILAEHGYIAMMDKELIRQGYEPDTTPLLSLE